MLPKFNQPNTNASQTRVGAGPVTVGPATAPGVGVVHNIGNSGAYVQASVNHNMIGYKHSGGQAGFGFRF